MSDTRAAAISFLAPLPPYGLRRNSQYRSGAALKRLKDEYSEQVWCAGRQAKRISLRPVHGTVSWTGMEYEDEPWERAHVRLEWRHHRVGPDRDNALASCKTLIDTLTTKGRRPLGIVLDDTPERLTVEIDVVRVRSKAEEGVYVTVEQR